MRASWLRLPFHLAQRALGLADIVEGELAGLDELRHHGPGAAVEERQQIVEEAALRRGTRDAGGEDVEVADFFHAAHHTLGFKPVNRGLHGGVGRALLGWERLLELADG